MKKEITIHSFAKINLSLDVKGQSSNGYHQVDMIMQQLAFHDDVRIIFREEFDKNRKNSQASKNNDSDVKINIKTNKYYLPTDDRNLAYKAAQLMIDKYGTGRSGHINIDITKRIPVAAGLAGGSGNGAAVLHGLNVLWKLGITLSELKEISQELGSDVPFCLIGQVRGNKFLKHFYNDENVVSCMRAVGTGTDLIPLKGINLPIVIAKPSFSISTAQVYKGIDSCNIKKRPDNDRLSKNILLSGSSKDISGNSLLKRKELDFTDISLMKSDFINVLEEYTLKEYQKVGELKDIMRTFPGGNHAMMSGSGPTIFAITKTMDDAIKMSEALRKQGYEAYWTRTKA